MEGPRIYNLFLDFPTKVMPFVILGIFSLVGASMIVASLSGRGGPPLPFALFWTGIVFFISYQALSIPYRIVVHRDPAEIEFISLVRRRRTRAADVLSIKPLRGQVGFLSVSFRSGKVKLLNQFDGFHDFLAWLKTQNSSVELRGC